ncbi:MAG: efflux RND transporter periplasmic adaptor subunit [Phascolarctobacterium sp.]|nr:efflux RND transporter periplasmic adaptor subunit [Phascolarctobacterium sp.]
MFSFIRSCKAKRALAAALAVGLLITLAGCGKEQQSGGQATLVKTMQVINRDTPIVYDYTGFVKAQQEMELRAQVTGQITGKFFKGGDTVTAGQVLYSIDQRTYLADVLNAQAALANARAAQANASVNAERYIKLYEQGAVSKQTMDDAVMQMDQSIASVEAQEALLEIARINMSETNVTAPFNGRIDTTALEVGNYVTAGSTVLATISDTDPVFIEISIAEPEYLELSKANSVGNGASLDNLTATLSDGSTYELKGRIAEVNRGINDTTGTLTVKALFDNPNRRLLPGMFAHVQVTAGVKENAMLVPQRAIVEMMYKKFVYIVGDGNKAIMKEIVIGPAVGRLFLVESGLTGNESVVTEGTGKITNGALLNPQSMTEADLNTSETIGNNATGLQK